MNEQNLYDNKIKAIKKELPDSCVPFIEETGTEMSASTRYSYATELMWFFKYLIDEIPDFNHIYTVKQFQLDDIKKITSQDISKYLSQDKDKGHAEKTVSRRRSAISRFFTFLMDRRLIEYNPVPAASKVRLLTTVDNGCKLTKHEQAYHDRYRRRDIALISLILDTGVRISELFRMDIKDVNFENCSIYILRKGGDKKYVYFSDGVKELLLDYIEERKRNRLYISDNDPLFVTLKGARLSIRAIQVLVHKYASSSVPEKGNLITPHKLRASFAMEYYDTTKDILALQKKMGHNSVTTTNIYAKATEQKMKETRNILEHKRSSQGELNDILIDKAPLIDAIKTLVEAGLLTHEEAAERLDMPLKTVKELIN